MYRRRDAHPAPLHDRGHRPLPLRPGRGGPRPDAHHADRRQAQGDRQGRPPADVAARWQPGAVRRTDGRPGPRPDVRCRDRGPRRARLAEPARLARIGGDRLVPRRAGRPLARGAPRVRAAVRAAQARLRAARCRDGARVASRAGTRCTCSTSSASGPRWTAASNATASSSPTSASAGSRRSAASLCERCPGPAARADRPVARGAQAAQGLPAARYRGDRRPAPVGRGRARDRGRPARLRARRPGARGALAGVPRRGPAHRAGRPCSDGHRPAARHRHRGGPRGRARSSSGRPARSASSAR